MFSAFTTDQLLRIISKHEDYRNVSPLIKTEYAQSEHIERVQSLSLDHLYREKQDNKNYVNFEEFISFHPDILKEEHNKRVLLFQIKESMTN